MDEASAKQDRIRKAAEAAGLDGIGGCICFGGNTPELLGHCPCRGIDMRSDNVKKVEEENR